MLTVLAVGVTVVKLDVVVIGTVAVVVVVTDSVAVVEAVVSGTVEIGVVVRGTAVVEATVDDFVVGIAVLLRVKYTKVERISTSESVGDSVR